MCSPNSVSALQPTPSSSAPSLQFPTLPTRCPFAQSAVAVSHSSTPRRRSSSRFSKKVAVAVYHSRAPSRRLALSRSPSRTSLQVAASRRCLCSKSNPRRRRRLSLQGSSSKIALVFSDPRIQG
nr:hypothetical protein Itr_chr10CG05290 [Ipomoea trifida]